MLGFVQAQRGLGQVGDAVGIGNFRVVRHLPAIHNLGHQRSFAQRADDFIVIAVADQDQRIAFRANFTASTWTLVTSGQVASITRSSRSLLASRTSGATPCAL